MAAGRGASILTLRGKSFLYTIVGNGELKDLPFSVCGTGTDFPPDRQALQFVGGRGFFSGSPGYSCWSRPARGDRRTSLPGAWGGGRPAGT